jgi:aspartate racemase
MKKLGILGGLGPESTLDYYQTLIRIYRERVTDDSYPEFFINSIDLNKVRGPVTANDLPRLAENLLPEIEKLARAGAEFGLISANTPHIAFHLIAPRAAIPLISIVEAACAAAKHRRFKRVALFGTRFTMTGDFYAKPFAREGIELIRPEPRDLDYIHGKYMNELLLGKFLPETKTGLLAVVDRLRAKIDIDAVILAGTELPLILRESSHNGIPFLNTTVIHCEAAVTEMLK